MRARRSWCGVPESDILIVFDFHADSDTLDFCSPLCLLCSVLCFVCYFVTESTSEGEGESVSVSPFMFILRLVSMPIIDVGNVAFI